MKQNIPMKFDPTTGERLVSPTPASRWRSNAGEVETAWAFDPRTGAPRGAGDIRADPFGRLIEPPGEREALARRA
jgi:hypothetical protein